VILGAEACWARLASAERAVLGTVHPHRGVDAIPVVFALAGQQIVIPIDTVKAKRSSRLQRLDNLRQDPRCVLLVDEYRADWSQLWWVRVHARAVEAEATERFVALLADRYPPYRAPDAIASTIVLTPEAITGWAAEV
jgi:PPOX class probable F420-dependent enzyme